MDQKEQKLPVAILSIVKEILKDKSKLSKDEMFNKYAAFRERFITLFELLMTTEDNMETLRNLGFLADTLDKREKGLVGEFDADIRVSGFLADKYMYKEGSGIKKPDAKTIEETTKKLRKKHDEEHEKPMPDFSKPLNQ